MIKRHFNLDNLIIGFGVFILIIVLVLFALYFHMTSEQRYTQYLINTKFEDYNFLDKLEIKLNQQSNGRYKKNLLLSNPSKNAHKTVKGDGVIYSYRWRSADDLNRSHDVQIELLTIWVEKPLESNRAEYSLEMKIIKAVFTKGNIAYRSKNCSGVLKEGSITIDKNFNFYTVSIKSKLEPMANINSYCKAIEINKVFKTYIFLSSKYH